MNACPHKHGCSGNYLLAWNVTHKAVVLSNAILWGQPLYNFLKMYFVQQGKGPMTFTIWNWSSLSTSWRSEKSACFLNHIFLVNFCYTLALCATNLSNESVIHLNRPLNKLVVAAYCRLVCLSTIMFDMGKKSLFNVFNFVGNISEMGFSFWLEIFHSLLRLTEPVLQAFQLFVFVWGFCVWFYT